MTPEEHISTSPMVAVTTSPETKRAAGVKLLSVAMDAGAVNDGLMALMMLDIIPDPYADQGKKARLNGNRPRKDPEAPLRVAKPKPGPKAKRVYSRRAAPPEWLYRPEGFVLHAVRPGKRSTVCSVNLPVQLEWRTPTPEQLETGRRCRGCVLKTGWGCDA